MQEEKTSHLSKWSIILIANTRLERAYNIPSQKRFLTVSPINSKMTRIARRYHQKMRLEN